MNRKWAFAWLAGILVAGFFYLFVLRNTVIMAYQDAAPTWLASVINSFYPRFIVEKHRFGITFFLSKADQVMLRFSLINILLLFFLYYYKHTHAFAHAVQSFWNKPVSIRQVKWVSILFYSSMLILSYSFYASLSTLARVAVFYKPLLILKILHIPFPSSTVILVLFILLIASCISVITRLMPVTSSVIAVLIFLLFQAWLYSFEKIDHTFATFNYAAMLMPFLLYEQKKAAMKNMPHQAGWPLQLICLCIGLVYLMSGLEKVLISGINWISADSFRSYIFLHQAPVGMWIAQNEWLSRILPAMALLFQLGFITIVFYPKLKIVFLLMGIAFHMGTYLLFGVGWYAGPWVFVYLFFINWDELFKYLSLKSWNNKYGAGKALF